MKKQILLGLAMLSMLAVGCSKDSTEDNTINAKGEVRMVEMTAAICETGRTALTGTKLAWEEGDQIGVVYSDAGTNKVYEQACTVDHLTGKVAVPEGTLYAFYPYSDKTTVAANILSLTLPYVNNIATADDVFSLNPMVGQTNAENTTITFKNLMGYVAIPLTGTGKLSEATLKSEVMDWKPLSGAATVDMGYAEAPQIVMSNSNTARAFVNYKFAEPIDLSTNPTIYFAVPAASYSNMALILTTDAGKSYSIYASSEHAVQRSKIKPFATDALDFENSNNPTETTPLDANGYANCYIVAPEPAEYKFEAKTVKESVLEGGVSAEIIWSESVNLVYDLTYDAPTNTISFRTGGDKGNALIGLVKDNFGGDMMVWSWLIWCTDEPQTITIPGGDNPTTNYLVMDRAIGATYAPTGEFTETEKSGNYSINNTMTSQDATDACGAYYQYQNRVPYPRMKNIDYSAGAKIKESAFGANTRVAVLYGFSQYGQKWTASSAVGAIGANGRCSAHNFPNYEYYKGVGSGNIWTSSVLIGGTTDGPEGSYRLWISPNTMDHDTMMANKTDHDPCPPGYIIENSSNTYHYVSVAARAASFGYTRNPDNDTNYAQGYKVYGMYLNGCKDADGNSTAAYWPCCGNRYQGIVGTIDNYGNMGYMWSVNSALAYDKLTTFGTDPTYYGGASIQYCCQTSGKMLGNPNWNAAGKIVHAQAYNVRCRK